MEKVNITIFISQINPATQKAIDDLEKVLQEIYPDNYSLDVINVLKMPEKAIEQGIFVTPTLVRNFPKPILKVLGDLYNMREALTKIEVIDSNTNQDDVVII